tara:strand:- start:314 stop:973 length:660 start_codon:yes stop_codon:yes gene_type:complete
MAITRLGGANAISGVVPVANGGTGLASGTTDQFLKFTGTTTIASAADNGGLVKIATVTADNSSAAMDLTGASSTYDSYLLVGGLISPTTSDSSLECQILDSGGSALTDAWDVIGFDGNNSSQALLHGNGNGVDFNPSGDENTAYQFSFHMYLHGLNEARQPNVYFAGSNTWASFLTRTIGSVRLGKFANATANQTGIRFKFHNGSNFNTGKITMFGIVR